MSRWVQRVVIVVIVLGVLGAGAAWYLQGRNGQVMAYRTAPVKRGDLLVSISATGTVEPEEVIDVGAQVAGQILSFGKDANGKTVDYGSVVEAGTVLAQIDDSLYTADAAQAEAQVQSGQGGAAAGRGRPGAAEGQALPGRAGLGSGPEARPVRGAGPSQLRRLQVRLRECGRPTSPWARRRSCRPRPVSPRPRRLRQRAQRNLGYCTITSPVKGVIIDRRVNIGQTVVASLNAPSLFLIAKDLTRMQVWVAVNEADIGKIHPGQPVTFTVDAFPGETFQGEVGKVRLNATMTQNVVTYTVEIVTDNSNGRLLPYLTANVQFELDRRGNVLLVPNAALRWTPPADQVAPEFREAVASSGERPGQTPGRPAARRRTRPPPPASPRTAPSLWRARGRHRAARSRCASG